MQMNTSGYKSENDVKGIQSVDAPAHYLAQVTEIDASKENLINATFGIIAGTKPGQAGKTHSENFFYKTTKEGVKEGYSPGQIRLAIVTGAFPPGVNAVPNWPAGVGRIVVIHVDNREVKKKDDKGEEKTRNYVNISEFGCAIYSVENPEVAQAISHPEIAAALANLRAGQPQIQQQAAYQQPQQYVQQPAPTANQVVQGWGQQQPAPFQQGQFTQPAAAGQFAPPAAAPAAAGGKFAGL